MGMLALAQRDIPGRFLVISVDHDLRAESAADAAHVAAICADIAVPCHIHKLVWPSGKPAANVQAEARAARYAAMRTLCETRNIPHLVTAHHADDQAETVLMRLARGSGLSGLSGIRASRRLGGDVTLSRPCLHMPRTALIAAAWDAGFSPREDPSNSDERYERTRFRAFLAREAAFDPARLAQVAAHLAQSDDALEWVTDLAFESRVRTRAGTDAGAGLAMDPHGLPAELRRRLMLRAFAAMAAPEPRAADLGRFMDTLESGGKATLSGLYGSGGAEWTLLRE
ncbi:tRNA lysidine(34) synthetase TilS [Pacificimonas sp. WHA3]|uniref:tRNA(Ile)-lysidine synthase n=2 Tax=Pacificimonas pallii TaxID=2827236 RepID=A0ABS6SGD6_9SPHN|nr:tRNA lysidine(34) synthetase TilS [Pacificimonas pallii]